MASKYTAKKLTGTNCTDYYNRDDDGKYTSFYDFNNMDELNEFLTYVFEVTFEYNKDTLLYHMQMAKIDGYQIPVPKIIELILNCKIQKSKLLHMFLKKEDVEKYISIIKSTYKPTTVKDIAITQFINILPVHVIDSLKNILDINENSDNVNVWQDYSTLLSFVGCSLDSKLITYIKPINEIKKVLEDLNLPVRLSYIDLLLDAKFKCTRNIKNLYRDFFKKTKYERKTIPIESFESNITKYNEMNNMLLKDFFDKNKNPLCSLPPSVLFLLLIKINPNINEPTNHWNVRLKKLMTHLSLTCNINKADVDIDNKKQKEMNLQTIKVLTEKIESLKKEYQNACDTSATFGLKKSNKKIDKDTCDGLYNQIVTIKSNITQLGQNKDSGIFIKLH